MGKIRNMVYAVSVAAGLTLVGKCSSGMYQFSNALQLIEDYEATYTYLELKTVADVDENGELSEIERKLMYARLDDYKYGTGGNWLWKDVVQSTEERIMSGGRMYWTPKDRSRISHALSTYIKEKD